MHEDFLGLGYSGKCRAAHMSDHKKRDLEFARRLPALHLAQSKLLELQMKEQTRWVKDRDFEDRIPGESCTRRFFRDVRGSRVDSHMTELRDPGGKVHRTMPSILKATAKHFMDEGAVLNRTPPQNEALARQKKCQGWLLQSLTKDNRILSDTQSNLLQIKNVFTPDNIQKAIMDLNDHSSTVDGLPPDGVFQTHVPSTTPLTGQRRPTSGLGRRIPGQSLRRPHIESPPPDSQCHRGPNAG